MDTGSSGVPGGCSRRFIVSHWISVTCVRQTEWPAFRHKALLKRNLRRTAQHQPRGTPEEPKLIPQCVVMGPVIPPSHQHRQVISPLAIDCRSVSTLASVFTLTSANGLLAFRATRSRSWGYMPTHGPYQLPENVSTTTLPRYSPSASSFPS